MTQDAKSIDILMYHSISNEPGPTRIPPDLFRQQMDTLKTCGCAVVPLRNVAAWHRGEIEFKPRTVVITFDDAFDDFRTQALPVLEEYGFPATVFVPTDRVGGFGNWDRPEVEDESDRLMTWAQIRELTESGIDIGSHSVTHSDLTAQRDAEVRKELEVSKKAIEEKLGSAPTTFAPPFGRATPSVLKKIKDYFELSVGTRLGRATRQDDLFDLPRIEMHYFRDLGRWRAHLSGQGQTYFATRQGLRFLGNLARKVTPT